MDSITGLLPNNTKIFRGIPANNLEMKVLSTRLLLSSDAGVERIQAFDYIYPEVLQFTYYEVTREDQKDFLDFFHARKARLEAFWFSGEKEEFKLAENAGAGAILLQVYDNRFDFKGFERIYIDLYSAPEDLIVRHIVDHSEPIDGKVTLTLDTPTDRIINVSDVKCIGRFYLGRFDIDEPEISYKSMEFFDLTLRLVELVKDYAQPTIEVVSPNGGEVWATTEIREITWNFDNIAGSCKIELYINEVFHETLSFSTSLALESFNWFIPVDQTISNLYKVRITSLADGTVLDESDNYFSIVKTPETLTIQVPNGGEIWERENTHKIKWTSTGLTEEDDVRLYDAIAGRLIQSITPNDGEFDWYIDTSWLGTKRMGIVLVNDGNIKDLGAGTFQIIYKERYFDEAIEPDPEGGTTWIAGSTNLLQFTYFQFDPTDQIQVRLSDVTPPKTGEGTLLQQWDNLPVGNSPCNIPLFINLGTLPDDKTYDGYLKLTRTSGNYSGVIQMVITGFKVFYPGV